MTARDLLADQLGNAVEVDDADGIREIGSALASVIEMEGTLRYFADDGVYVIKDGAAHKFRRAEFEEGDPIAKIASFTKSWEARTPLEAV